MVSIKGNELSFSAVKIADKPQPSQSGKSLILFSTHGNVVTTAQYDGKPVIVSVNVYVKA